MQISEKEKAQELIDKMSFETHKYNAIHCALVCVDEIINSIEVGKNDYKSLEKLTYYLNVKGEILKHK